MEQSKNDHSSTLLHAIINVIYYLSEITTMYLRHIARTVAVDDPRDRT